MNPQITLFLDKRRSKDNQTFPLKLRVWDPLTKRAKLIKTHYDLSEKVFKEAWESKKAPREYKDLRLQLEALKSRANEVLTGLTPFSFEAFETQLNGASGDRINVIHHYEKTISSLKRYGQVGTASTYALSLKSLLAFAKTKQGGTEKMISFYEITPEWLHDYEYHNINILGKSKTTVSMYLRALRAVFNKAIASNDIKREQYPFGFNKYQPPAVNKVKKALSSSELRKLFESKPNSPEQEKAKDFWFFSYLSNGMNIKDIALLKYKDIDKGTIRFYRAKTINTNKGNLRTISVFLNEFSLGVIEKYGIPSESPDGYVFNILNSSMNAEQQKSAIQNFTRFINQHIKKLCTNLNLPDISTYWARHSFATMLIRQGAAMEMVQESLGHGNLKTTMNYFAGFEDEAKRELTDKLLNF